MFAFDYIAEIAQEAISKLSLPFQALFILLLFLFTLNTKIFDKWIESHRTKLNRLLIIAVIILSICIIIFLISDRFYFPKPSEDRLVVAIAPFYYTDESGKDGADINTADDFEEMIMAEKDLEIKVIRLNNPIRGKEDAKTQGKKVGAHLVVYGETKKKIGNIVEIKYYILPLPCLAPLKIPLEMPFLSDQTGEAISLFITEKATFSIVTEDPITITESLKKNASSAIYILCAFENYKKSNFSSAISFFDAAKNYENYSSILFYIGNCYYFNNSLNESVQYLDKAVEINPQFAEAWYNKGIVLFDLDRYEEAVSAYDAATTINPQFAEAWYNKGNALLDLDRYEEAIAAYDNATAINRQHAWAWNNKGVAFSKLGRYEKAVAAYDNATTINPQQVEAWSSKGIDLGKLGRYEEAIVAFDNATKINPKYAEAWFNKGVTFSKLGKYSEAIVSYDNATKINPQYAEAWDCKGIDLGKLGKYEEAIVAFDNATEINPQYAGSWYNKGNALYYLYRYEEAIVAFDNATDINPQYAKAWYNKGVAFSKLGRYEEAKEAFEKAHEIDPAIEILSILIANSISMP